MNSREQDALIDMLQRPTTIGGFEGMTRLLQWVEQAATHWRSNGFRGAAVSASKIAAAEVALIAEGGLRALGRAPECKNWFGPLGRPDNREAA